MGTMTTFLGEATVTGYSNPSGETSEAEPVVAVSAEERAMEARISVISCTRALTSLELVFEERSCESLAWTQGCVETVTFGGTDMAKARLRMKKPWDG
jgi:hypothetical protein